MTLDQLLSVRPPLAERIRQALADRPHVTDDDCLCFQRDGGIAICHRDYLPPGWVNMCDSLAHVVRGQSDPVHAILDWLVKTAKLNDVEAANFIIRAKP